MNFIYLGDKTDNFKRTIRIFRQIQNLNSIKTVEPEIPSKKLIAKNLIKSYKDRKILNNINIELDVGEVVGLLGPNGAGKQLVFILLQVL